MKTEIKKASATPEWYWTKGLHDAVIEQISLVQMAYDYTQKKPIRNYLSIKLDSKHALFDTSVKEIKLYNAKVVSDSSDYSRYWWVKDSLKNQNGKYILNIRIANAKEYKEIMITFDHAELLR